MAPSLLGDPAEGEGATCPPRCGTGEIHILVSRRRETLHEAGKHNVAAFQHGHSGIPLPWGLWEMWLSCGTVGGDWRFGTGIPWRGRHISVQALGAFTSPSQLPVWPLVPGALSFCIWQAQQLSPQFQEREAEEVWAFGQ